MYYIYRAYVVCHITEKEKIHIKTMQPSIQVSYQLKHQINLEQWGKKKREKYRKMREEKEGGKGYKKGKRGGRGRGGKGEIQNDSLVTTEHSSLS